MSSLNYEKQKKRKKMEEPQHLNPLYSMRKLTQRFGEREVLNIDALDIEPGGTYALLGANGAGKSTLMRILAFLDAPSGGELLYKGQSVTPGSLARFRPGVVWVPQFPVMFTGSLLYNIEYPLVLKKVACPERRKTALKLLELVNLTHLCKAPAHKLSGGEAQRAGIARALAAGAHTLLFDEPTANADQRSQGDFIKLARNIQQQQHFTMLIATHNPELAATLCRKQIFLSDGKLANKRLLPGGEAWPGLLRRQSEYSIVAKLLQTEPAAAKTASANILHLPSEALKSILYENIQPIPAGALQSVELCENIQSIPTGALQSVELVDSAQAKTGPGEPLCATVRSLSAVAAGTRLKVALKTERMLDILLEDAESIALAESLTLGAVLGISIN